MRKRFNFNTFVVIVVLLALVLSGVTSKLNPPGAPVQDFLFGAGFGFLFVWWIPTLIVIYVGWLISGFLKKKGSTK
jgi:hypothetical protein